MRSIDLEKSIKIVTSNIGELTQAVEEVHRLEREEGFKVISTSEYRLLSDVINPLIKRREKAEQGSHLLPGYKIWTNPDTFYVPRKKAEVQARIRQVAVGYFILIPDIPKDWTVIR